MKQPRLVRVNSEQDFASLEIGDLVVVSFNYGYNNRRAAYHGNQGGQEIFVGPRDCALADPTPIICLWEHDKKYLAFNNGMVLLNQLHLNRRQVEHGQPEYEKIHPIVNNARIYL